MTSYQTALTELAAVFSRLDDNAVDAVIERLAQARRIVVFGGGREKLQIMGFAMRLFHIGLQAAVEGDMTTPAVAKGDVFLVTCGPGWIATAEALKQVARSAGAEVVLITAQTGGRCSTLADLVLHLPAQTMADDQGAATSVLPMGSLFEGALFVLFEVMVLKLNARLGTLPIAQRQIVAIARALVSDARLIFMDEPTASLTQAETDALLHVVRTLSGRGVAVVFVSHRLAEVLDISSRVTVLRDGRLVGVYPTAGMTQSRLTELMTGRTFDQSVAAQNRSAAPVVLEVAGLTRRGDFADVSFKLHRGEVLGLTGLIGAGRTELAHVLFGMARADAGTVSLNGDQVRFGSNRDAVAAGVAYVSEDRLALGLIQPQSISDNAVLAVLPGISGASGLLSAQA